MYAGNCGGHGSIAKKNKKEKKGKKENSRSDDTVSDRSQTPCGEAHTLMI